MEKLAIDPDFDEIIRKELEHHFGRNIASNRDCIALSEDVFRKTHQQLNPNTLRRIFGLVKSKHSASHSTRTILAHYCGFSSVQDIFNHKHANNESLVAQERLLKYVVGLFLEIPAKSPDDAPFLALVRNTISFLNQHAVLGAKFLGAVAKTKNGQYFYFECFVNTDKLNGYYGNCIRYYLLEKSVNEAEVFAHSVLLYKCWLNGDSKALLSHALFLTGAKPGMMTLPPLVAARYFAALVLSAHALPVDSDKLIADIQDYYETKIFQHVSERLIFCYYTGLALALSGHFQQSLKYTDYGMQLHKASDNSSGFVSMENLQLLKAVALAGRGNSTQAKLVIESIDRNKYHFLDKRLMEIVHLTLQSQLNSQSELLSLARMQAEEMGYGRFVTPDNHSTSVW